MSLVVAHASWNIDITESIQFTCSTNTGNRSLVRYERVEFENQPVENKNLREITDNSEESLKSILQINEIKNSKMSTCN